MARQISNRIRDIVVQCAKKNRRKVMIDDVDIRNAWREH